MVSDSRNKAIRHAILGQVWAFFLFLPSLRWAIHPANRYTLFWTPFSTPLRLACVMALGLILFLIIRSLWRSSEKLYSCAIVTVSMFFLAGQVQSIHEYNQVLLGQLPALLFLVFLSGSAIGTFYQILKGRWKIATMAVWIERITLFLLPLVPIFWINLMLAPAYRIPELPSPAQTRDIEASRPPSSLSSGVYIFVLDGWPYRLAFDHGEVSSSMPRLRSAARNMCVFHDAHAAGCHTMMSMTRFLFQREDHYTLKGSDLGFWETDFRSARKLPTIFDRPRQQGYRTYMIGWYHPYQLLVGHVTDMAIGTGAFHWIGESPGEEAGEFLFDGVRRLYQNTIFRGLRIPAFHTTNREFVYNLTTVLQHSEAVLDSPDPGQFAVFHLPLPHFPFCFGPDGLKDLDRVYPKDSEGLAMEQIRYTDMVLDGLLERIRRRGRYDESTIVLTSDHTWREDPSLPLGDARKWSHVPLLIKLPRQTGRVEVDGPLTLSRLERFLKAIEDIGNDPARIPGVIAGGAYYWQELDEEAFPGKVMPLIQ
jgi:hypothetical protein